jgi:hypothetical protein
MSDASRHALYYVKETTYGTTPNTPTMKRLRHTSATLGTTKSTNVSEELSPDRQIKDFRHGTKQVGGDVGFELSYGTFDDMLEAVTLGTWTPKGTIADDTLSVDDSDDSFLDSGLLFIINGFQVGDIVTVTGFTTPANNGTFKITVLTAGRMTVTKVDDSPADLVDEAAGDAVDITATTEVLKVGVARRSFTFMRHFSDIQSADKPFHLFKGVELNMLSLSVQPGAIITGTFGVLGREPALATTAPAGSTLELPTTSKVYDSFTGSLKENGATIGIVTEISLSLENGLEPRFVVFSDLTLEPSIGRSNCTGQITVYFENATMLEKFLNETASSLEFSLVDEDGNTLKFTLPNIKYTGGQPDVSNQGSITLAMPFQAIYDAGEATQLKVERIPA